MSELLPCPFCGSDAVAYYDRKEHPNSKFYSVAKAYCTHALCGIGLERWADRPDEAVEKAIAAWNTRVERTCRITHREDYAPEQSDCQIIECSNGCFFYWPTCTPLFYCPKCGARVVNENKPVEVWQQASDDDVTCYEVEQ